MILLNVIVVLLFINLLFFVNDKYAVSFLGMIAIVAGAWYYIPEVAAFVATHGVIELGIWCIGAGVVLTVLKNLIVTVGKNAARSFDYAFAQFSRRMMVSTVKDMQ